MSSGPRPRVRSRHTRKYWSRCSTLKNSASSPSGWRSTISPDMGWPLPPLMLGAWLAARTSKIRIGTAVIILPLHNLVMLAEQVAMLDVLSGGRVDVGVGRGEPHPSLWANMNIPREDSEERFQEALDLLPQLWTTQRLAHQGKHHDINDITVVPAAKQTPHPPIYMGISWERGATSRSSRPRPPHHLRRGARYRRAFAYAGHLRHPRR